MPAASIGKPRDIRLEHFARTGFAARGAVYMLIGGLALLGAIGSGLGGVGGSKSALRWIVSQPFGVALLGAVGLGLAFFAAWRLANGLFDADHEGGSAKGLGKRALHVFSAAVNGALALTAFYLALGFGAGGGDDDAARDWTQWLLSKPFGRWLTAGVGLAVIGAGAVHVFKAWKGDVLRRLAVPADKRALALALGRLGYAARGVVFGLIGAFLVVAAAQSDSSEARGLGGALQALEQQPYGWAPLGVVAAGLAAFGAFCVVQAIWRRIGTPDLGDARQAAGDLARKVRVSIWAGGQPDRSARGRSVRRADGSIRTGRREKRRGRRLRADPSHYPDRGRMRTDDMSPDACVRREPRTRRKPRSQVPASADRGNETLDHLLSVSLDHAKRLTFSRPAALSGRRRLRPWRRIAGGGLTTPELCGFGPFAMPAGKVPPHLCASRPIDRRALTDGAPGL